MQCRDSLQSVKSVCDNKFKRFCRNTFATCTSSAIDSYIVFDVRANTDLPEAKFNTRPESANHAVT
jgi:hypothetical protein